MQKGFAPAYFLIGILVILAVAGGAYYFSKSSVKPAVPIAQQTTTATNSADTANWKTYTNKKYGYSIKHPGDFYLINDPFYETYFLFKRKESFGLSIEVNQASQETFLKEYLNNDNGIDNSKVKPETYNLGGIAGIKIIIWEAAGPGVSVFHIFAQNKGNSFIISGPTTPTLDKLTDIEVNNILSTFKFQ